MTNIRIRKIFGHCDLVFGYYLGFGIWDLVIGIWSAVGKLGCPHRFIICKIVLAAKSPDRLAPTMP
jgi:hypothetical protein